MVSPSLTLGQPAKATGRNEMPFGRDTRVVRSNTVRAPNDFGTRHKMHRTRYSSSRRIVFVRYKIFSATKPWSFPLKLRYYTVVYKKGATRGPRCIITSNGRLCTRPIKKTKEKVTGWYHTSNMLNMTVPESGRLAQD